MKWVLVLLLLVPAAATAQEWTIPDCRAEHPASLDELDCWRQAFVDVAVYVQSLEHLLFGDGRTVVPGVDLAVPRGWSVSEPYHSLLFDSVTTAIYPDIFDNHINARVAVFVSETALRGTTLADHLSWKQSRADSALDWAAARSIMPGGTYESETEQIRWGVINGNFGYAASGYLDSPATGMVRGDTITYVVGDRVYDVSFEGSPTLLAIFADDLDAMRAQVQGSYHLTREDHGELAVLHMTEQVGTIPVGSGEITRVVDGDTIDIDDTRYVLSMVNAPNRGKSGFAEATDLVKDMCPAGSPASYMIDVGRPFDPYGRLLAEVWCGSESVQAALLETGHAEFLPEYCANTSLDGDWLRCPSNAP